MNKLPRCFLPALAMAIQLIVILAPVRAGLLEQFQSEYPIAAKKLDDIYLHSRIVTEENYRGDKNQFLWSQSCEYLRDGDFVRKFDTITKSDTANLPEGTKRALGGSSSKYFVISSKPPQKEFLLQDFGPLDSRKFAQQAASQCAPAFALTWVDAVQIPKWVKESTTRLISAVPAELDGTPVIEVVVDDGATDQSRIRSRLYFFAKSWALAGATMPVVPGGGFDPKASTQAIELRVAYANGDPSKLTSLRRWECFTGTDHRWNERFLEVKSIEFGAIQKSKFSLEDFGVREPVVSEPVIVVEGKSGMSWFYITNLVVLIVIGCTAFWLSRLYAKRNIEKR